MKRALLINPPIHDFTAFDLWMKPLGLLYVGAAMETAGWKVDLLDCLDRFHPDCPAPPTKTQPRLQQFGCGNFLSEQIPRPKPLADVPRSYHRYGLSPSVIQKELARRPIPDLIAVTSMMTYWYPGVFEIIRLAKETFPSVPVFLGGVYATLCRDHAERHSGADRVLAGPGELGMMDVMREISGPIEWKSLTPAYHLMRRVTSVNVLTSRGCPFGCTYCASRELWPRFVQRNAAEVVNEIETLTERLGVIDVAFCDDALLLHAKSHILPILRELRKRKLALRFHTPNGLHTRMMDEEMALELRTSHFVTIRLSFETASEQRQIDSMRKISNDDLRRVIANLLGAGYSHREIEVYVMMGLPGQDSGEVEDTLQFVHDCGGWIKVAQYSPIPGTEEFDRAAAVNPAIRDEPLLHNKTVFAVAGGPERFASFRRLKGLANSLNRRLVPPA
ncbi:MAG: B12-binding domain-containing radical SAM protein [Planctomycetes bacterium]|nr:B12-binding domain-containing radical SAM protein [Planctomycetota bacterium]